MPLLNRFRSFEALDDCHKQIQHNLDDLTVLAGHLAKGGAVALSDRTQAGAIESFFSSVAKNHHAAEEQQVFPFLLSSENTETVAHVRRLIEDHFWIEKYWHDLAPMLKDISQGWPSADYATFGKAAALFLELCNQHIESEESMIYPQAKAVLARKYQ
jgi:hemerythrin-like domain-containing protein